MNYVIAGYIVTFVVLGTYAASLTRRQRMLRRYLHRGVAPMDATVARSGSVGDASAPDRDGDRNGEDSGDEIGPRDGDQ
jgi:hypothetical protein